MKHYILILLILFSLSVMAQNRTFYGVKTGINKPPINDGFVWDFGDDNIDSDLGFLAGAEVLIPISELFNFNTGLYFFQETYHIHFYAPNSLTYHFYYTYFTLPIAVQYKFYNKHRNLKPFFIAGTFINYGNFTNKKLDNYNSEISVTNILEQEWSLEPQLFGGLGLLGISGNMGSIQLQLSYHFSLFKHLNYEGILKKGSEIIIEERKARHIAPLFSITYYPRLRAKRPNLKWSRCK